MIEALREGRVRRHRNAPGCHMSRTGPKRPGRAAMRLRRVDRTVLCLASLIALAGCGFIPMAGPASLEIRAEHSSLPYALVQLDPRAVQVLANYEPNVLPG